MRVFKMLLGAGVAPLLIAAQNPPTQAAPAAQQPAAAQSYANTVVCKKFPPPVGSRIGPRKICKTQAEWDLIRLDNQEVMERVQGINATNGG